MTTADDRVNLYTGDDDVEYVVSQPEKWRTLLVAAVVLGLIAWVLTYLL